MGVIRVMAEVLGVLLVLVLAAHAATYLGARTVEAVGVGYVAAVVYGWGVVKIHEKEIRRSGGGARQLGYGVVKAK